MRRALSGMLVVATLLAAGAVPAGPSDVAPGVVLLRMQGHTGAPRDADRRIAELTFRRGDATIAFQVDEVWVLSGDAADHDILHEVEPYTPSMSLAGPPEVVDKLVNARPDERLEVTGYFRRGQRMFSLSAVEPAKQR